MKRWLLLFFLLFVPSIVSAQTVTSSDGSAESATTNAVFAYDAATTNPSVLFVCGCTGAAQATLISDTGTHTWNAVAGVTDGSADAGSARCWYANNTSTTAPTVTVTSATNYIIGVGIELTGAATSGSLEQTGTALVTTPATSITVTSGSVTSSTQKVVVFGCSYNNNLAWTPTTGNTENKEHNLAGGYNAVIMSKDATTGLSGAQTIVMDRPSSGNMSGVIGTFKAAAVATAPRRRPVIF